MKPASYPFLAIAKKYNADYTAVLKHADWLIYGREGPQFYPGSNIVNDIADAASEFLDIRAGLIDWQTGEPLQC